MAKKKKVKDFQELHYHISNNGDGSASIHFHKTKEEAEKADADMDEGWGEPCNGSIELKIIDGKIHYHHEDWDADYNRIDEWRELS